MKKLLCAALNVITELAESESFQEPILAVFEKKAV